jgi:prepilin-type N-terminal cleavage/methylation domain-containing protein
MMAQRHRQKGFTIVELAIVLVVIGAIMGSIFVGQSLIRSSHLNSVVVDVTRYTQAFTDFRDKYQALPGDFANAQAFWGVPSGGCPEGNGTGNEVCNGNGDGHVCDVNNAANVAELKSAWIELANAGFIPGSYRYTAASSGAWEIGLNLPPSAITLGSFQFYYATCLLGDGLYSTETPYNIHWLSFGGVISNTGVLGPILTGAEAFALDTKLDNGMPGTGTVRGGRNATVYGFTPNCQTSTVAASAEYNQGTTDNVCFMIFALTQ